MAGIGFSFPGTDARPNFSDQWVLRYLCTCISSLILFLPLVCEVVFVADQYAVRSSAMVRLQFLSSNIIITMITTNS